jgi:hypothetical protein
MKWIVPNMWKDGTCVIIGGGSSLLKQFDIPKDVVHQVYAKKASPSTYSPYLEPLHGMHTIAVNVAYQMGSWIDVMFFGDDSTWHEQKVELLKWKGLRVHCCTDFRIQIHPRLKYLERDNKKYVGISNDPGKVVWNQSSGGAAINFAVHTGVKRIILLGFDMKLDEKQNQHWHKYYSHELNVVDNTFKKHLGAFPAIAKGLREAGIECINTNPDSAITEFPRMNFKDIKL